jgi:hypothetical protein
VKGRVPAFERDAVESLEREVARALESPDTPGPEVLGYGEISCVLALRFDGGGVACKRLPPFPSEEAFEACRSCFEAQLEAFDAHGIPVLATELHDLAGDGSGTVAYCVQPLVDEGALVPARLAREPAPYSTLIPGAVQRRV